MRLHTLKAPAGSNRKPVRKGRGTATGQGKTAGRGQDGQKSRSGGGVRLGFEGGQMPLTRRVPKRGFTNDRFKKEVAAINVDKLNSLKAGTVVTIDELKANNLIKSKYEYAKILSQGELKVALTIKGIALSKAAYDKVIAAGGKVEE